MIYIFQSMGQIFQALEYTFSMGYEKFCNGCGKFLEGINNFCGKTKQATILKHSIVASYNIVICCVVNGC